MASSWPIAGRGFLPIEFHSQTRSNARRRTFVTPYVSYKFSYEPIKLHHARMWHDTVSLDCDPSKFQKMTLCHSLTVTSLRATPGDSHRVVASDREMTTFAFCSLADESNIRARERERAVDQQTRGVYFLLFRQAAAPIAPLSNAS